MIAKKAEESIRVSLDRLEHLVNLVGEMVILQSVLRENSIQIQSSLVRNTIHQLGKVTQSVQDLSMSLRMVPLRQTFQKMQRIVRDVSRQLGKQVDLVIAGEETEVDKTVLEFLGDPLVHLVRNAVDHGIESPAQRATTSKPAGGRIELKAYHRSGNLMLEVIDDGGGIDADRLRAKAVEKGILKPGQNISDEEARHLIFHPGFSTKEQVSDISGRGVGMDVVKTQIERLQGEIAIQTQIGRGTRFTLRLPLTLAILEGMIMRCGSERFVVPLAHVHETVRVNPEDTHFATGLGEVLMIRGESIPIYHLSDLMKIVPGALPSKGQPLAPAQAALASRATEPSAVIVRLLDQPFAVHVDEILGQNQVVVKKLGSELSHLKTFSGGTILGDGRPSLILELIELVRANGKSTRTRRPEQVDRKTA
jgi:two-component system chemotaxis sensor kinase CheA